tara:strand:- start:508 stop:966 length:459 start_codon:yes stop_codon:yes gene_type:complete
MATIIAYPTNNSPKVGDLLLGTKTPAPNTEEQPITNNFSIASIAGLVNSYSLGYTVYTALLNQAGTAAPVATTLQNTTGKTFVWTRQSAGNYTITASTALFTVNKTIVFGNQGNGNSTNIVRWNRTSDTTIALITGADARLVNGSFEIRIYS